MDSENIEYILKEEVNTPTVQLLLGIKATIASVFYRDERALGGGWIYKVKLKNLILDQSKNPIGTKSSFVLI